MKSQRAGAGIPASCFIAFIAPVMVVGFIGLFLLSCGGGGSNEPLALDALYDYDAESVTPETEIEDDPAYGKVVRSLLEIGFFKDASPEEFNSLLDSISGEIINMLEGVAIVIVRIPDPGSIPALEDLIQDIEANPIVRFAGMCHIPEPSALPANYTYDHTDLTMIDHNLAVRGHAAWNLRDALTNSGPYSPPLVLVADQFGKGRPVSDFGFELLRFADFLTASIFPENHGYHVIGIIGADFGGSQTDRGWATGLYPAAAPDTLPLRVVDMANGLTGAEIDFKLIKRIEENPGRNIVVNTSFGFPNETQAEVDKYCSVDNAQKKAVNWIEKVRDAGVEDRFVHITAAGNSYIEGDTDARLASRYAAAKLLGGLEDCWLGIAFCTPVENIRNVLVVENQRNSSAPPFQPICLDASSKFGGNVSAIGTSVWSLYDPEATAGNMSGTSMASPQVAALAAYIWALNPSLSAGEVISIISSTARVAASFNPALDPNCSLEPPAPVIDAYAAALAADAPSNPSLRKTLFDVTGEFQGEVADGVFDEHDIARFLENLNLGMGELDYSRYDLNGDGRTGGGLAEEFDLDMDGLYGNATQGIQGGTVSFDETQARDKDILCYYAYSSLFGGDQTQRDTLLEEVCPVPEDDCTYTGGEGDDGYGAYVKEYEKVCEDEVTGFESWTRQRIGIYESYTIEWLSLHTFENGDVQTATEWRNNLNLWGIDAPCQVTVPGWIIWSTVDVQAGIWTYFSDDNSFIFPSKYYFASAQYDYCWPDANMNTPYCGEYVCPPLNSIQPVIPFPGDCHDWWDHYDDEGNWVTCNY